MHPDPESVAGPNPRRVSILLAVCAACLLASVLYVQRRSRSRDDSPRPPSAPAPALDEIARVRARPHLVFLESRSRERPRLAFAPLDDLEHGRIVTGLECERVYAAKKRLLGLRPVSAEEGQMRAEAFVLDEALNTTRTLPLVGLPSRVRASSDGSFGAVTLFTSGDSYLAAGFSTRTYVFDLAGRGPLFDLERLRVSQGGTVIDSPDFNYWGVTFGEPSTRFFASLASGGVVRLVEASLETGECRTLHERVECPALSPDRTRLCYKRLSADQPPNRWALALLDLSTLEERVLSGEEHSVDDQVEWLDEQHVLYARSTPDDFGGGVHADIWSLDVDADGPAHIYLREARSPSVVRP